MQIRVETKVLGAKLVGVAPGLVMHAPVKVTAEDVNGFDVKVEVIPEGGRLVAQSVAVSRRDGGPAVTGEALRAVPVATLTKYAASSVMTAERLPNGELKATMRVLTPELANRLRLEGTTDQMLEWVAFIYRLSRLTGEPPAKSLGESFEVSRATAGRWIAKARERGFLEPVDADEKAGVVA